MSDRALIDRSAVAPKGRYEARVRLERAGIQRGPVMTMGNAMPTGTMKGGAFKVESGAGALSAALTMGMETAPVAMTRAGLRSAHKAGLLAGGGAVANFSRRGEIRRFGGSASVGLVVDLTDMWRLAKGFRGISVAITKGHAIISRAVNDGARTLKTGLRRKLKAWTGIRSYAETERGMRMTWSTPATMTAVLRVTDRHRRITTANFGARWSRADPGGTHAAWNRPQMAVGTFMIRGGKRGIRGDLLFKRVGRGKYPIAPLWGPNMAREIRRHEAEVQRDVVQVARVKVQATAVRLMAQAIAKGGA